MKIKTKIKKNKRKKEKSAPERGQSSIGRSGCAAAHWRRRPHSSPLRGYQARAPRSSSGAACPVPLLDSTDKCKNK